MKSKENNVSQIQQKESPNFYLEELLNLDKAKNFLREKFPENISEETLLEAAEQFKDDLEEKTKKNNFQISEDYIESLTQNIMKSLEENMQSDLDFFITNNIQEPLFFFDDYTNFPEVYVPMKLSVDGNLVEKKMEKLLLEHNYTREQVHVFSDSDSENNDLRFSFNLILFKNEEEVKELLKLLLNTVTSYV